jgi:hypothetical protein
MREINKSRLELFVESYLKQNKYRLSLKNKNFLKKVRTYIEQKLNTECCDDNNPVVDLFTKEDNQFTRTVYNLLLNIDLFQNKKSIQRTLNLIVDAIDGGKCCVIEPDIFITTYIFNESGADKSFYFMNGFFDEDGITGDPEFISKYKDPLLELNGNPVLSIDVRISSFIFDGVEKIETPPIINIPVPQVFAGTYGLGSPLIENFVNSYLLEYGIVFNGTSSINVNSNHSFSIIFSETFNSGTESIPSSINYKVVYDKSDVIFGTDNLIPA